MGDCECTFSGLAEGILAEIQALKRTALLGSGKASLKALLWARPSSQGILEDQGRPVVHVIQGQIKMLQRAVLGQQLLRHDVHSPKAEKISQKFPIWVRQSRKCSMGKSEDADLP